MPSITLDIVRDTRKMKDTLPNLEGEQGESTIHTILFDTNSAFKLFNKNLESIY